MYSELIRDAQERSELNLTRKRVREGSAEIDNLKHQIETLELTCAGLWELLRSKLDLKDEELLEAIRTADARDGVVDGRIRRDAADCATCGRKQLSRRSNRCNWCGAEMNHLKIL